MNDRSVTPPITADHAARIAPGPGTVVHRKPLTVVVSTDGDPDATARSITAVVDELVAGGELTFGPVAAGLQQFVVDHQPSGVAAVLDVAPDAIAFLFDQAAAIGTSTTHRAAGRSGWTTVFVEGESVSLVAGPGPERPVDPWTRLWAGTVAGQGVQVDLTRSSQPAVAAAEVVVVDDDIDGDKGEGEGEGEGEIAPLVDAMPGDDGLPADEIDEAFQVVSLDREEPTDGDAADGDAEVEPVEEATADEDAIGEATPDDIADDTERDPSDAPEVDAAIEAVDETDSGDEEDLLGHREVEDNDDVEDNDVEDNDDEDNDGRDGADPVIELDAEPIDLSTSAMPSWDWPPPQPEPASSPLASATAERGAAPRDEPTRGSVQAPEPAVLDGALDPTPPVDAPPSTDPVPAMEAGPDDQPDTNTPKRTGLAALMTQYRPNQSDEPGAGWNSDRPSAPTQNDPGVDTPPSAPPPPEMEPIAGPPPMPTGLPAPPPPTPVAEAAEPIAGPPPMPTGLPAPPPPTPVAEAAEPIAGPPPMPSDLPPPPPGATPIAGAPPMPDSTQRSTNGSEPD